MTPLMRLAIVILLILAAANLALGNLTIGLSLIGVAAGVTFGYRHPRR